MLTAFLRCQCAPALLPGKTDVFSSKPDTGTERRRRFQSLRSLRSLRTADFGTGPAACTCAGNGIVRNLCGKGLTRPGIYTKIQMF